MEATKPVQQAFGSPGGKSYLAPRIAAIIPPHNTYVEPFAGGAAVYFRKEPSQREILSDKDSDIAFAFKFLRDMTPQQWGALQRKNWTKSASTFNKLKQLKPTNDVDRFYRFYYLRKASFAHGSKQFSHYDTGEKVGIDRLERVHERLKHTTIHSKDATTLIDKYDSPNTFFYLDPPYPDRAFVGRTFKDWTEDDLTRLVNKLKHIKGKFALSLGTEHAKALPGNWHINRVKVWRRLPSGDGAFNQTYQYEIIATNYDPNKPRIERVPMTAAPTMLPRTVNAPQRCRVPQGVFTDKAGTRLSRRYHRGWKRARVC